MSTGEVIWFDMSKGYGFISDDNGGDVFVHHSAISKDTAKALKTGVKVSFDAVSGERGMTAGKLEILS